MEEQIQRKEPVGVVVKEPVKAEDLLASPDTSERSEGAASPPPNCSICLGKLKNTSFTDSCLHQFCFTCLLQWSKIKTECPLCKQTFKSIIHNVRSEEDYDQYHVPRDLAPQMPSQQLAASLDVGFELVGGIADVGIQRFVYRTTMTPNRRYNMLLNPEQVARREQIPNMLPPSVSREERRYRRFNPAGYRRNVYQHGEWSNLMPDVYGRFRECSAEYYRRNPSQLNRLIPWINRELQTLLSTNESHIAYVINVVTETLTRFDIRSAEFRNTIRPYFGAYTDHFAHELLNYARTSFDLIGYDQYVTYPSHGRGFAGDYIGRVVSPVSSATSSSSDDSDVRVLDQTMNVRRTDVEAPSVGPHVIDMPGPSTVAEAFHVPQMGSGRPDILTISSSCSSSEECEVVGYVKPRHERTPEVIELLSSDGVEESTNNPDNSPHTPVYRGEAWERQVLSGDDRRRSTRDSSSRRAVRSRRWSTTSGTSTSSDTDTDYSPTRRRRKKSSYSKARRARTRKCARKSSSNGNECQVSPQSRSDTRRKQASCSSSSIDDNQRHNLRKNVRERGQTQGQRVEMEVKNRNRNSSTSSETGSDERDVCATIRIEVRKALEGLEKHSSTSSESDSGESIEQTTRRRRRGRSRKEASIYESASDSVKISPTRRSHRQPVSATILRKNATNPNQWYIKTLRGRSRSSSTSSSSTSSMSSSDVSSLSSSTTSSNSAFPKRRLRTRDKYRHKRETSSTIAGSSGLNCNKEHAASTKSKADDGSNSVFADRSNGHCSSISGRTRAKELTKRREGLRKRKMNSESSDSEQPRRASGGASASRKIKRKDDEKRTNHNRKNAAKRSETKRNDRDRSKDKSSRIDHGRKKDDNSKSNDREKRNNHERKVTEQASKSSSGSRKKERDQPSTSKHSDSETRSVSKDKHKRKKKQKAKRRRSRSESKTESRSSRYRMKRSSSYSAPTTNLEDP